MAAIVELHKVTSGGKTYFFKTRTDTYEGSTSGTGVSKAADNEQSEPAIKVAELLNSGIVIRIKGYGKRGNRPASVGLLVEKSKLSAALDGTGIADTINGITLNSFGIPRDQVRVI